MENRNFYPWFLKLSSALSVYFDFTQRLSAIATASSVSKAKRIADIQHLLIAYSEALEKAEQDFLTTTQFPTKTGKCYTGKVAHNVMGMEFTYFVN